MKGGLEGERITPKLMRASSVRSDLAPRLWKRLLTSGSVIGVTLDWECLQVR